MNKSFQELASLPLSATLSNLLDMNEVAARKLVDITAHIEYLEKVEYSMSRNHHGWEGEKAKIKTNLQARLADLESLNLKFTAIELRRVLEDFQYFSISELSDTAIKLRHRLNDELDSIVVLQLSPELSEFYSKEPPCGTAMQTNFPTAHAELRSASKCLALSQPTACVFHLMRATECAVRATASGLSLPDPTADWEKNWGNILRRIKAQIDTNNSVKPVKKGWKSKKEFFETTYAFLEGVRNPWRNKTMHIEVNYDETSGREIYHAVCALFRQISSKLSE